MKRVILRSNELLWSGFDQESGDRRSPEFQKSRGLIKERARSWNWLFWNQKDWAKGFKGNFKWMMMRFIRRGSSLSLFVFALLKRPVRSAAKRTPLACVKPLLNKFHGYCLAKIKLLLHRTEFTGCKRHFPKCKAWTASNQWPSRGAKQTASMNGNRLESYWSQCGHLAGGPFVRQSKTVVRNDRH